MALPPTVMKGAAYSGRCWIVIKLNILNMNGFLQIVNQCSGAVNAIFPDGNGGISTSHTLPRRCYGTNSGRIRGAWP